MTGRSNRPIGLVLLTALGLLLQPNLGLAQQAAPPAQGAPSKEAVIAAIKRRAKQILEQRRLARRLRWAYREFSQVIGYENNPANASAHVGDTYLENNMYLMLSKKLSPTVDWVGTYYGAYVNYLEYGDGDYFSNTLTPVKLRWRPGAMWRLEGWVDLDHLWYPSAAPSNYRQFKVAGRLRQNLFGTSYHQAQYEWLGRDYLSKRQRDDAGNDLDQERQDTRHRWRYKVGTSLRKTLFSVENDWQFHNSNDRRNDFYDAQTHKVTASVNHPVNQKLSLDASYAYERKRYNRRPVTGITAEARYDSKQTWTASAKYLFNDTWSLSPKFEYKELNSNEPTGEYADATSSLTVSARF